MRLEEEHKTNSPWNIAVDFTVDMSLPLEGIEEMLKEYEADHHTGMDTLKMAELLHDYTSGYPYLVSRLCKLIDERIGGVGGKSKERRMDRRRISGGGAHVADRHQYAV